VNDLFTVDGLVALSISEAISVHGSSTDSIFGDFAYGRGCFCKQSVYYCCF
jgi:hypothetical protein